MRKYQIFFVLLFTCFVQVNQLSAREGLDDPPGGQQTTTYPEVTVKVVVHWFNDVPWPTNPVTTEMERIVIHRIRPQIEVLNAAFAPAGVRFELATQVGPYLPTLGICGVIFPTFVHEGHFTAIEQMEEFDPALDTRTYMNIYVGDFYGDQEHHGALGETIIRQGYLFQSANGDRTHDLDEAICVGIGSFFSEDNNGIISIDGKIAIHEAGHWFGLDDIWTVSTCAYPPLSTSTYMDLSHPTDGSTVCGNHFSEAQITDIRKNIHTVRPWLHGYKVTLDVDMGAGSENLISKSNVIYEAPDINGDFPYTLEAGKDIYWPKADVGNENAYSRKFTVPDQSFTGDSRKWGFAGWNTSYTQYPQANANPFTVAPPSDGRYTALLGRRFDIVMNPVQNLDGGPEGIYDVTDDHKPVGDNIVIPDATFYYVQSAIKGVTITVNGATENAFFYRWSESAGLDPTVHPIKNFKPTDDVTISAIVKEHLKAKTTDAIQGNNQRKMASFGNTTYMVYESAGWIHLTRTTLDGWTHEIPVCTSGTARNPSIGIATISGVDRLYIAWEEVNGSSEHYGKLASTSLTELENTTVAPYWNRKDLPNYDDAPIHVDIYPVIDSRTTDVVMGTSAPKILCRYGINSSYGGLVQYVDFPTGLQGSLLVQDAAACQQTIAGNDALSAIYVTSDPTFGTRIQSFNNFTTQNLSDGIYNPANPSLTKDPADPDRLLLTFDALSSYGYRHIFFCERSAEGTWSSPVELNPGGTSNEQKPTIGCAGNMITILWEETNGPNSSTIERTNRFLSGGSWVRSDSYGPGSNPQVSALPNASSKLNISWVTGDAAPFTIQTQNFEPLSVYLLSPENNETGSPSVTFHWKSDLPAANYELQVCQSPTFEGTNEIPVVSWVGPGTSHQMSLDCEKTYYWRLRAIDPNGIQGSYSPIRKFMTTSTPLLLSPTADAVLNLSPTLRWTSIACAKYYTVRVTKVQASPPDLELYEEEVWPEPGEEPALVAHGLEYGTRYSWQVKAIYDFMPQNVQYLSERREFITSSPPIALVAITAGWNLVSVPLAGTSFPVQDIYPGAISAASGFSNGYHPTDPLIPGSGYWLKFGSDQTINFYGNSLSQIAVPLQAGWNIVGSLSQTIASSTTTAPMPLLSPFFGHDGSGYLTATTISPGKAYWLKSSVSQTLTMQTEGGSSGPPITIETAPPCGPDTTVPIPPTLFAPLNGLGWQGSQLKFYWSPGRCQGIYQFELSTTQNFSSGIVSNMFLIAESIAVSGLTSGTQYYWRVRDSIPPLISGWSEVRSVRAAAPLPPQLAFPADVATGQAVNLDFGWNGSAGAVKYQFQLSSTSGFSSTIVNDSTLAGLTRDVPNLSMGTVYYWRVRASNDSWWGSWSSTRSFTTGAPPPQVVLASPANNATNQLADVTFRWNYATAASTYRLQVSLSAAFVGALTVDDSTLTDTSRLVTGLLNLNSYYWRVSATNAFGTSAWSGSRSVTIGIPPATPTLVSPASASTNISVTPTLTWNSVPSANYRLQLSKVTDFSIISMEYANLNSTSKVTGYLDGATQYFWRVNATTSAGTSAWSTVWNFTTISSPVPQPPTLASPANNTTGVSLEGTPLTWNASSGATQYHMQVSTSSSFAGFNEQYYGTALTYNDWDPLAAQTVYYWRVQAQNASGWSAWSTVWQFTTVAGGGGGCGQSMASTQQMDALTVTDAAGMSQTLYLYNGMDSLDQNLSNANEMPPEPVPGAFSVRFETGKFFESLHPNKGRRALPHIRIRGAQFPVTIDWDLKDRNKMKYWMPHPDSQRVKIALQHRGRVGINRGQSGGTQILALDASANSTCGPPILEKAVHKVIDDGANDVKPKEFALRQNMPNPFNPTTIINYELPADAHVELRVYNMLGQEVATLADQIEQAGYHAATFNASNVASGVYFYRFKAEQINAITPKIYTKIMKMVLLK